VTLSVLATGTDPLAYQWKKDGTPIPGATNSSFSIASVAATDAGRYAVTVSNTAGNATSAAALLSVVPSGVTATHSIAGTGYMPGGTVTVSNTLAYTGSVAALGWQVIIPDGWSFASGSGAQGDVPPSAGRTNLLEWAWSTIPASPISFSYTLNVPVSATGDQSVAALVSLRLDGNPLQLLAQPDPLVIRRVVFHSADANKDSKIDLFELVRIIELYNTRNGTSRVGGYKIDAAGEDGFAPDPTLTGATTASLAYFHTADSNHDGKLSLSELTRVIELYNFRAGTVRTGAYHAQAGTEDGFATGP
jgi:hypothetical protein